MSFFGKWNADNWSDKVHKVIGDIAKVTAEVAPIVVAVSSVVNAESLALGSNGVIKAIQPYLNAAVTDTQAVQAFLTANATAPVNSILHNAAVFVASKLPAAAGMAVSTLDLAVQTAYNTLKQNNQLPAA